MRGEVLAHQSLGECHICGSLCELVGQGSSFKEPSFWKERSDNERLALLVGPSRVLRRNKMYQVRVWINKLGNLNAIATAIFTYHV